MKTTRLFDRLMESGFLPSIPTKPEMRPQMRKMSLQFLEELRKFQPTVLAIDNVAHYFWEGSEKDVWSLDNNDFPCLAPPWPLTFMEYAAPQQILLRSGAIPFRHEWGTHFGVLFHSRDTGEPDTGFKGHPIPEFAHLLPGQFPDVKLPPEIKWEQQASVFAELRKREIVLLGTFAWMLDSAGGFSLDFLGAAGGLPFLPPFHAQLDKQELSERGHNCTCFLHPACLALSFIHCRNTQLVDNQPGPDVVKRYRERNGFRPTVYKTLEIEPIKKLLANEGNSAQNGLKLALHICRGHFKDYRETGLFGKHKGLYWWDRHARGSMQEGIVVKDYRAPKPIESK